MSKAFVKPSEWEVARDLKYVARRRARRQLVCYELPLESLREKHLIQRALGHLETMFQASYVAKLDATPNKWRESRMRQLQREWLEIQQLIMRVSSLKGKRERKKNPVD